MPTYEYYCSKCETSFDKILKIADREIPTTEECPGCNVKGSVELRIGASSLIDPFRLDGLKKPRSDFRERMQQIKALSGKNNKIRDY
jgi:putative FmdB family regulatory protein